MLIVCKRPNKLFLAKMAIDTDTTVSLILERQCSNIFRKVLLVPMYCLLMSYTLKKLRV